MSLFYTSAPSKSLCHVNTSKFGKVSIGSSQSSQIGMTFKSHSFAGSTYLGLLNGVKCGHSQNMFMHGVKSHALSIENGPSFAVGKKFQLDDVIEAQQFDRDILSAIFEVAREMEKIEQHSRGSSILKGYLMATLFYEPSTRTRLSFESAMKRLGGEVLTTENAREFSSAAKGETLEGRLFL